MKTGVATPWEFEDHVYVIAEVSANHRQDLATARSVIEAAAATGADAVKLQTYHPDSLTFDSDAPMFRLEQGASWDGRTLHSVYSEGYLPWEWHEELFAYANSLGLDAFSSPFDRAAVDLLDSLDVPALKIASFEITDTRLIEYAARTGRPIIISTGIATEEDIERALEACSRAGNDSVALLKCTSTYPAALPELNLLTIPNMRDRFGVPIGFSDHTIGATASVAAVALGACIVEKHLTLDRGDGGLDSGFSTTPQEFTSMVQAIRETEQARGSVSYELSEATTASRKYARSLFVVSDVASGDVVSDDNVRSIRPFAGIPAWEWDSVVGARFIAPVRAGTPLDRSMLSDSQ